MELTYPGDETCPRCKGKRGERRVVRSGPLGPEYCKIPWHDEDYEAQCWWPGCHEPRIQPSGDDHDTRGWKVCLLHFAQLVRELHEAMGWK